MLVILQNTSECLRVDERMSKSFQGAERIFDKSFVHKFPCTKRNSLSLSRHLRCNSKHDTHNGVHQQIYYVSKALQGAKPCYPNVDKLALAIIISGRRLRPYFQAHPIVILTDQPLPQTLGKPDVSGRLVKWFVELGEFDNKYWPRTTIKGQAVAEFATELTTLVLQEKTLKLKLWQIYVDGSSNHEAEEVGLVIEILEEEHIEFEIKLEYSPTNNEAEYEALIAGLLTT